MFTHVCIIFPNLTQDSLLPVLGSEPKNHLNENIRRMRQIQRENKRREKGRIREQPVKALWKSSKFENVPPRVFDFQVRDSVRHHLQCCCSGRGFLVLSWSLFRTSVTTCSFFIINTCCYTAWI